MARLLIPFSLALFALRSVALALPTYMQDDYPPDLITVVNQRSGGGQYYLKSLTDHGYEGDCVVQKNWHGPSYSKEHEIFTPNFFIKGGDLYSMSNSTHVLQVVAINTTDHSLEHDKQHQKSSMLRYKLQMVDPKKAKKNIGIGEGKYAPGTWSWYGPILLYSFGPQHKELKGSLFYSCPDGVYLDVHSGPPPHDCEPVTLHARNVLKLR